MYKANYAMIEEKKNDMTFLFWRVLWSKHTHTGLIPSAFMNLIKYLFYQCEVQIPLTGTKKKQL